MALERYITRAAQEVCELLPPAQRRTYGRGAPKATSDFDTGSSSPDIPGAAILSTGGPRHSALVAGWRRAAVDDQLEHVGDVPFGGQHHRVAALVVVDLIDM